MSKIRDHMSDTPARVRPAANRARTKVSNAWHRAAGNRIQGARTGLSNRKNRRTIERGKAPRRDRVAAEVRSRVPVYRNWVNPAHGNPHREDARLHRAGNESLARMKTARDRAVARQAQADLNVRVEQAAERERVARARAGEESAARQHAQLAERSAGSRAFQLRVNEGVEYLGRHGRSVAVLAETARAQEARDRARQERNPR